MSKYNNGNESPEEEDDYFIPLEDQRVFGAGIKRKRIHFVPATTTSTQLDPPANPTSKPNTSIGDRYLSIVLSSNTKAAPARPPPSLINTDLRTTASTPTDQPSPIPPPDTTANPQTSIIHQLSLPHSTPPSSLPRSSKGLQYLVSHGWDPDSRSGLGPLDRTGIRVPLKVKRKVDTAGLGVRALNAGEGSSDDEDGGERKIRKKKGDKREERVKVKMVDAGRVRVMEKGKRRRAEELRGLFYGEDLERYLGPGG